MAKEGPRNQQHREVTQRYTPHTCQLPQMRHYLMFVGFPRCRAC
jgi:hypothetical protein